MIIREPTGVILHPISNESKVQFEAFNQLRVQRLDGVLDLTRFKCSLSSKYTSCEGPLRSTECSTSNDQGTHLISKYHHARAQRLDGVLDLKMTEVLAKDRSPIMRRNIVLDGALGFE